VSFRKNWLPNAFFFLLNAVIFKQQVQPWLENLLSQPRDRVLRVAGYIFGLSLLLFGLLRARTLWPWVRNLATRRMRSRGETVALRLPSSISASISPPELPPGTASAILMAMQPPPPRSPLPQFVNNSQWMQWEAYQRHHDIAVRSSMVSTMPGFRAALL
jgi:hypothetical protein